MHWILAHLIGDFLFQTDWMARGKKNSSLACLLHVATYMLPFLFTSFSPLQLLCIAIQHFIQDRTTMVEWFMNHTGKRHFAQAPHTPWSLVIIDFIFHILAISLIEKFL